uniref:Uncharacterized protein n=1 Tax=Arundo donax TaxID=35708 RepID=A0A0A9HXQ2_ARUDO
MAETQRYVMRNRYEKHR